MDRVKPCAAQQLSVSGNYVLVFFYFNYTLEEG